MSTLSTDPAFPLTFDNAVKGKAYELGLTKREFFAAIALQGLLAHSSENVPGSYICASSIELEYALSAVRFANALILALNTEVSE